MKIVKRFAPSTGVPFHSKRRPTSSVRSGCDLVVVLHKPGNGIRVDAAGYSIRLDAEDGGRIRLEVAGRRGRSHIGQCADIPGEAGNEVAAELAAKLEGVLALRAVTACPTGRRSCRAPLRETRGAAERQADIGERDLRQPDVAAEAVAEAHAGGIGKVGRVERDGDAVEAEARFIHELRVEDMRLADGADLAMRMAMVAPAWNSVALQCGLCADVLLERIETMQRIGCAELLQNVAGVLVDLHRAGRERDVVCRRYSAAGSARPAPPPSGHRQLLAAIAARLAGEITALFCRMP